MNRIFHLAFLRSLFVAFLTSPWGLIAPLTGVALLLGSGIWSVFLASNPALFWDRFDATPPSELPQRLESFAQSQDFTLPTLVAGLGHKREAIHTFCRQRLLTFVTTDASFTSGDDLQRCRRLATYLADMSSSWGPSGRLAAAEIARAILYRLTNSSALASAPHTVTQISDACTEVIGGVDVAMVTKSQAFAPSLAQSRGGPPSESDTIEEMLAATKWRESRRTKQFDTAAPETMLASRDASDARQALSSAFARPSATGAGDSGTLMAMQNSPAAAVLGGFQGDSGQTKIASRVTVPLDPPKRRAADYSLEPVEQTPLGSVAMGDVQQQCSPPELMRLLHHPSGVTQQRAKETLVGRDRFTPELLRLAYRLYHPDKAIRLELVSQLPGVIGVTPIYWWDALAADPHPDVRYAAISFLATLQDPKIRQRVTELSRADSDPRIVRIGLR